MRLITATAVILAILAAPMAVAAQEEDPRGFDLIDSQGKGYVTLAEYLAAMPDQAKAMEEFQIMDSNHDGMVTKEEFLVVKPVRRK